MGLNLCTECRLDNDLMQRLMTVLFTSSNNLNNLLTFDSHGFMNKLLQQSSPITPWLFSWVLIGRLEPIAMCAIFTALLYLCQNGISQYHSLPAALHIVKASEIAAKFSISSVHHATKQPNNLEKGLKNAVNWSLLCTFFDY